MKRWTRKLLAGLLSVGMLLQVASPLSALAAETPTVESYITVSYGFSSSDTSVTYVLNRYTNGSVSWEGGKNPWDGVDVWYDTNSNTYVFSGTLSVPADRTGDTATLICSDPDNDSIKINGGNGVAVDTSLKIGDSDTRRGAKNVTVLANSNSTAINGSAAFDCNGDVTIMNPIGAVTRRYGSIVVYNAANDIVITGKSGDPLIGGSFFSYSSGNITIENPDGADVGMNLSISGAAEVKLTGSDSSGLVLLQESSYSTFNIEAKALTMENKIGPVGKVKFTKTGTGDYYIATGDSASSASQTEMKGNVYAPGTVSAKYLYIGPGTPENTTPDNAKLKITAGDQEYRIDPQDISGYGEEYTIGDYTFFISYLSEYDEFDIYGTVPGGTQIEGIGTHRPALQMTASTADEIARPLTYGSLTIKNMGDVDLNGVIHENLTIENVKDVSSGVVGYAGSGNLIINGAENVKHLTHVCGTIDINCTGEVNIYGSRNGSVSDGANITAKSLMMKFVSINGSVGNVGHVKFTRTDTAGNYRILTGENEDTITSQTAMNGETFDQTVEETYLCIEPGEPEDTSKPDVLSYGFKVNGETANENTLPVGLVYANGKLTASTNYTGALAIEVTDPALKLDVSLQSVTGDVTLLGVNDVAITGTVNGMLTVGAENAYASGNVTVNGQLLGGTEINCIGNVKATGSSSNGGILKAKDLYQPDIIRCNGTVYLENTGNGYTTCSLTVIGATDVTVKANGEFHAAISGEGNITCSGTVTLTTTGKRAMGSNDPLTYTPMQGGSYTVKLDDQTPFTRTGIFNESEVNLLRNVKSIIITPAGSTPAPDPDDGDTTPDDTGTVDSASDAGGAVAAVLVGSAAVWGGYEIATRVILHNILPEGAAIPANRGQLALLVWNNAGRPAPVNEPAFADMDDADMAKAAQWCMEQGIMEAKTAETFKPEGWTPKLKVIEVWNKAFPKQ